MDDEIVAQILWLGLAALFLPQPDQRRPVCSHDDPGVRPADEAAAVRPDLIRILTARCAIRMSPRRIPFCSALEASHRSPQWLDVVEGARRTHAVALALEESLSEDVHLGLNKALLCIR